jgi:hypothetical protein
MKWDPLLHWMAHVGEGSWASFKRMAASLSDTAGDQASEIRRLRTRLSDLGIAEFFVGNTGRWRTFRPVLAASPHRPRFALLCGGRTAELVRTLRWHAERLECQVISLSVDGLFSSVQVHGPVGELARVAGIEYEPDIARRLSHELVPLTRIVEEAAVRPTPYKWTAKSFDLRTKEWVPGVRPQTVVEYTSSYQERVYLLPRGPHFVELPKREAVFAAAGARGVALAGYLPTTQELFTPPVAPLPEAFARAACVASGRPSVYRD